MKKMTITMEVTRTNTGKMAVRSSIVRNGNFTDEEYVDTLLRASANLGEKAMKQVGKLYYSSDDTYESIVKEAEVEALEEKYVSVSSLKQGMIVRVDCLGDSDSEADFFIGKVEGSKIYDVSGNGQYLFIDDLYEKTLYTTWVIKEIIKE